MSAVQTVKTNFSAGEVSLELLGRSDLKLYQNGAKTLENVFVQPTGGVTRRHGLRYVDPVPVADARLIPFENNGTTYLLEFMHGGMAVYKDDIYVTSILVPWTLSQIGQLAWVQSANELLLMHPDVAPWRLTLNGGTWALAPWTYETGPTGRIYQPHYKFVSGITLTPSGTTGTINVDASAAFFTGNHINARFRLDGKEIVITNISHPTSAIASVIEPLSGTAATNNWTESAFSNARGWPVTAGFHQDRLVIGGSRDLRNRLFLSKTGKMWNFDLGTGLDDEAIEFSILSDQSNAIRGVFSARHLQIFTSGSEWMVTGTPLTPSTLQLQRQTRVGSRTDRYIPPQDADGATYFISRDGSQLREFYYNDVEGAYAATDLAIMAKHMVVDAVDQAYDAKNRLLHVVLANGTLTTLTVYRTEGVTAWSRQVTDGQFKSVRAIGDKIYVTVLRGGTLSIERFDPDLFLDAGRNFVIGSPGIGWGGLTHLNGKTVPMLCDGVIYGPVTVSGSAVVSPVYCTHFQIGLPYTMTIEPLPPSQINFAGVRTLRMTELRLRLYQTASLRIDTGLGSRDIPLDGITLPPANTYLTPKTGDVPVRAYGWVRDLTDPLWSIRQTTPLPFTLLSVTTTMKVNT